jgi:hypothetical protein
MSRLAAPSCSCNTSYVTLGRPESVRRRRARCSQLGQWEASGSFIGRDNTHPNAYGQDQSGCLPTAKLLETSWGERLTWHRPATKFSLSGQECGGAIRGQQCLNTDFGSPTAKHAQGRLHPLGWSLLRLPFAYGTTAILATGERNIQSVERGRGKTCPLSRAACG